MRREDLKRLGEPYTEPRDRFDRRFHSAIGADVPSANTLVEEIFDDLSDQTFGVLWWQSVPLQERILISDYLYQCAESVETNLVEAKLHYMEWQDVRERINQRYRGVVFRTPYGTIDSKHPPSMAPTDDLLNKLEGMHICGFLRAIGSAVDCLGGVIIGVLGLNLPLRWKGDIGNAERALKDLQPQGTPGSQIQIDFKDLFQTVKTASGPKDWLTWTKQYRNMYVHRGRRLYIGTFVPSKVVLLDAHEQLIPRVDSQLHLAKHPDKSDAETFLRKDMVLNEDAEITLTGVFNSTRNFLEVLSERLVQIWRERRQDPALIEQPATQWSRPALPCDFNGYAPGSIPFGGSEIMLGPIVGRRMIASATIDQYRGIVWANSPWAQ